MKLPSLLDSFNHALAGVIHTLRTQRNMKIHFFMASLVLIASLFVDISRLELIIVFFAIAFVIATELINTSIEVAIDMIAKEYRYQARIAKNISAGAVFLASLNAIFTGYLIFYDKLKQVGLELIFVIRHEPFHLVFINLGLLFLLVITIKSTKKTGTPLRGGMPSGHTALAFSFVTIIGFLANNFLIFSLALILAILVAQSRLEVGAHKLKEVITGACLGILLSFLLFYFFSN